MLGGSALADGFFGEERLLAEAVGDFAEFALVRADGGKIFGLADEVEGAESFPDLLVGGDDSGDFGASEYMRARRREESLNAAADRRAKFKGAQFVLRGLHSRVDHDLGDQAALVDRGSHSICIRHTAGKRSDDPSGLQKGDDLR